MPAVEGSDQGPRSYDGPGGAAKAEAATTPAPGTKTVTIIDGSTGKRQEVPIPSTRDVRAPLEQRLLENSRHGALPRIAPDGARPAEIYARAVKPLPNRKSGPRIAIVLGGLGISASLTRQAIEKMPGAVTFAFAPYGATVEADTTTARAEGHEILLQVPMEPFDYPDNDPGPQTLLTSLEAAQNLDRLHWSMSRFHGYVGITNYMGARFSSTEQALTPVLRDLGNRGLIYVDDGVSPHSVTGRIAATGSLPYAKADVTIDAVPNPVDIDRALGRLENIARERGMAIGYANALPVAIERIARWAKAAEGRGILLVPITAAASKAKSS
jgi:hypothetical protein